MKLYHLDSIRQWFEDYISTFLNTDPEGLKNITLKIEHTHKVCEIMDILTKGEGLGANDARIAAAIAILHDVGRFSQYRRWRTFRDSDSDNHARLAIDVIREHGLLTALPENERQLVEEAVRFHNLLGLPEQMNSQSGKFLKLIRDADKLDIWRVFLWQYELPEEERASAACLGLPDLPEVTPLCLDSLREKQVVRLNQCSVLNDFKLLQISWAMDLHFTTSYRLLLQHGFIGRLVATLNGQVVPEEIIAGIMAEVTRRAGDCREPDTVF